MRQSKLRIEELTPETLDPEGKLDYRLMGFNGTFFFAEEVVSFSDFRHGELDHYLFDVTLRTGGVLVVNSGVPLTHEEALTWFKVEMQSWCSSKGVSDEGQDDMVHHVGRLVEAIYAVARR